MDVFEAIKMNHVFRGLEPEQMQRIADVVQLQTYTGGDVIVRQFDKNYDLMIVMDGAAAIKSFSGETIAEIGPGSLIGEMSLIDDQPRSATVTAIGNTKVAILPYEGLKVVLEHDSGIAAKVVLNIAKVLVQRLRTTNIQLDQALSKQNS